MVKRLSLDIKKKILEILSDNKEHSFGDLERKVNTNWQTIRNQCNELEIFEGINIIDNKVRITEKGLQYLKKL